MAFRSIDTRGRSREIETHGQELIRLGFRAGAETDGFAKLFYNIAKLLFVKQGAAGRADAELHNITCMHVR